jgi:exportin-2 (importin alpha re-exporter)
MELSAIQSMRDVLVRSMSPDKIIREEAEQVILSAEVQPGFSQVLLALVQQLSVPTASPEDRAIRQSCSVLFKNLIKRRWEPEGDYEDLAPLVEQDRVPVKTAVVEMLCRTPLDVQKQLAEAVSVISKHDFPHNWDGLLPQLVQLAAVDDALVVQGAMLTANSIMKRFRCTCGSCDFC